MSTMSTPKPTYDQLKELDCIYVIDGDLYVQIGVNHRRIFRWHEIEDPNAYGKHPSCCRNRKFSQFLIDGDLALCHLWVDACDTSTIADHIVIIDMVDGAIVDNYEVCFES